MQSGTIRGLNLQLGIDYRFNDSIILLMSCFSAQLILTDSIKRVTLFFITVLVYFCLEMIVKMKNDYLIILIWQLYWNRYKEDLCF